MGEQVQKMARQLEEAAEELSKKMNENIVEKQKIRKYPIACNGIVNC